VFLSGGKTGAAIIDTDRQFAVALETLKRKKKDGCQINIEFDIDSIDGYRIRTKRVSN
jgi:hypothetical protein